MKRIARRVATCTLETAEYPSRPPPVSDVKRVVYAASERDRRVLADLDSAFVIFGRF